MSICHSCDKEKGNEFFRDNKSKTGFSYRCVECVYEAKARYIKNHANDKILKKRRIVMNRRWNSKNKEKIKAIRKNGALKFYHGISTKKYEEMYATQLGQCSICLRPNLYKRGLHVDHDHKTGEIRSLLCHGCNTGLGNFREDIESMKRAIEYLIKHSPTNMNNNQKALVGA